MSRIVGQAYEHLPKKKLSQNADVGGWSFLQDLFETKGTVRSKQDDETNKTPYVHPIEKRSVAKLSLEMCTESLGTENGSESGDDILLLAFEATNIPMIPHTTNPETETNFMSRENSFPPPLNSVNGNYSRMVRSVKEDGRLVVQSIRVFSQPRCFVSERSEGRLRLCLSEKSILSSDGDEENKENEWEYEHDENEDENEEEEEDDAEEEQGVLGGNENSEGEIGSREFRRPRRRCTENKCDEHKTMLDWKQQQQFWVTT